MRTRDNSFPELVYDSELALLPSELKERFVYLGGDQEIHQFIRGAISKPAARWVTRIYRSLRWAMSDYDAYGLLNMYKMQLLSRAQWERLIGQKPGESLLDIGAGDGSITAKAAGLFRRVVVTETSRVMARKLRRRGYKVYRTDIANGRVPDEAPFDVVACLNVIDRCARPISLLERIRQILSPSGRLVLAIPLPLDPFTYSGGRTIDQLEELPLGEESWEEGVASLVQTLIQPIGFSVQSLSRVPYVSQGDADRDLYILDDAVLVCRLDPARDKITRSDFGARRYRM